MSPPPAVADTPELQTLRARLLASPADHALALQLANALLGLGRPAEAVQILTARTRDPGCRERLREYLAGERELALLNRLLAHRIEGGVVARMDEVLARHLAGNLAEAIRLAREVISAFPQHAPAYNHLGRALFNAGDDRSARQAFETAVRLQPDYAEAHHNLAHVLRAVPDPAGAEAAFRRALALAPAYRSARLNLGTVLFATGQVVEALACFDSLLEFNPDHVDALVNGGLCRQILRESARALAQFERAARLDTTNPLIQRHLGALRNELGDDAGALAAYRRALELDPKDMEIWAEIAQVHEQANRLPDAANAIRQGLAHSPDHPVLNLEAAKLDRREHRVKDALRRLQAIDPERLSPRHRQFLHFELGQCLDRDGQPAAAIAAFERANALGSTSLRARNTDFDLLDRQLDAIEHWLKRGAPAPALEPGEDTGADLCFLLGFPRSGTTLLDLMIDAHPQAASIEEHSTFEVVAQQIDQLPAGYPAALNTLDRAGRERLRALYRARVAAHLGERAAGARVIVDKMPIRSMHAAVIHRLFPKARFLLSLRHPCDVVLSNFMQQYAVNEVFIHFYTVEESARIYDRVMRLWQASRERLPDMAVCTVRYEALVEDAEGVLRPTCEFLGLPWQEGLQEHLRHLGRRGRVATNSYQQVSEPIYTRAVGRWQQYRTELGSVLKVLKPHVERYGYSLVDAT